MTIIGKDSNTKDSRSYKNSCRINLQLLEIETFQNMFASVKVSCSFQLFW